MKRLFVILAALAAYCASAFAQEDAQKAIAEAAAEFANAPEEKAAVAKPKRWTTSFALDLGLNQTSLRNWAAGGYDNLNLSAGLDAQAGYAKNLFAWNNRLQLQYGFFWAADKINILQKSNDRIYLESKLSFKTAKDSKWNWTASYDFRSQFTDTWGKYVENEAGSGIWEPTNLKSSFLSPAYNNLALGIEWKPADWFDVNISPLTGSLTICKVEELRKSYGMPQISATDEAVIYSNLLFQFGASIKTNAKFAINDAFFYETQLVLFTDYLNRPFLQNRVNWDNKLTWNIAKFFKIGFSTWLIYDPIVEIDGVTSKIQVKDFLAFNFTYTISNKK
ncbi:MAG: DUF3078 domain-containing protein [Bacteroidales bacterium]|nr:DUF3078 domain-containing protein [Bacteroidales bacterium]